MRLCPKTTEGLLAIITMWSHSLNVGDLVIPLLTLAPVTSLLNLAHVLKSVSNDRKHPLIQMY